LAVIFVLALISIAFEIYSDAALTSAEVSHTSVPDPATAAIAHARGRSPMCDRVASPLLGRGAGGCSPRLPLAASVAPQKSPPNRYRESESGTKQTNWTGLLMSVDWGRPVMNE
jgi:hypothetical protein